MITTKRYNALKKRITRFDKWVERFRNPRTGALSYYPSDVPKNVGRVTNEMRSQVQTYEFLQNAPETYFVYVRRNVIGPGLVDRKVEVTTWAGQILGYGRLGHRYKCGLSQRYPIWFTAINGVKYRGIYYVSAGDYARVRKVKNGR